MTEMKEMEGNKHKMKFNKKAFKVLKTSLDFNIFGGLIKKNCFDLSILKGLNLKFLHSISMGQNQTHGNK